MRTKDFGARALCANITCASPIPPWRRSNAKYCSAACASVASSRVYAARCSGRNEWTPPTPRPCARERCDQMVDGKRLRRRAEFCSVDCQRLAHSRPAPARTCARGGCSNPVSAERARHGGRYCSDHCARTARAQRSAAHTKRTRALARQRAAARRDRALSARLETLSRDATARIRQLEAGTAVIARAKAELEEIAIGHEAAACELASWLWHVAWNYGDQMGLLPSLTSSSSPSTGPPVLPLPEA